MICLLFLLDGRTDACRSPFWFIAALASAELARRSVTSNHEEADGLFVDFGQIQQFNEIHSPLARFRLGESATQTDLLLYGRSRILECGQRRVRIGHVYATS
jgi:hypothetical protein